MARNYTFVINNYTEEDEKRLKEIKQIVYCIYGKEIAPTTGTPHLQGYMQLDSSRTKKWVNDQLANRAWMEASKGGPQSNEKYCSKDGQIITWGTPKQQGKRGDLDEVREAAKTEGMRNVTAWANSQQIRVAEKYLQYNEEARCWKPEVTWIWGPTNTGKSKMAHEMLPNAFTKSSATKWWCGYDGHDEVIIDDFRDSWWGITEMLRLLDRYECQIECKGGQRQFRAKKIVVTSAKAPSDMYLGTGEAVSQLTRRVDKVICLENSIETEVESKQKSGVIMDPDLKKSVDLIENYSIGHDGCMLSSI